MKYKVICLQCDYNTLYTMDTVGFAETVAHLHELLHHKVKIFSRDMSPSGHGCSYEEVYRSPNEIA